MTHTELELELPWYANGTAGPRESAAIERELATCATCAAEVADLRALGTSLRDSDAAAPAPSPYAFADALERIENDDPAPRRSPLASMLDALGRWWAHPRGRALGGALVACAFVAFFATSHLRSGIVSAPEADVDVATAGRSQATESYARSAVDAPPPAPEAVAAPEPALQSIAKVAGDAKKDAISSRDRQLARDGTIGLLVPDVATAIGRSERIAAGNFGVVTGLEDDAPASPGDRHTAQLTVSVPDDRFSSTIAKLATLGGVTARTVKTEDLTDSIVDSDARLRNLRREETDLLKIMDRSGKVSDVLDVELQLASTRESIEKLDAESQAMRRRVAYATIAISFSDEKVATADVPGPWLQIADAWNGALRMLLGFTLGLIAHLLVLVAFAPYLIVAAGVLYLIVRSVRKARANGPYGR